MCVRLVFVTFIRQKYPKLNVVIVAKGAGTQSHTHTPTQTTIDLHCTLMTQEERSWRLPMRMRWVLTLQLFTRRRQRKGKVGKEYEWVRKTESSCILGSKLRPFSSPKPARKETKEAEGTTTEENETKADEAGPSSESLSAPSIPTPLLKVHFAPHAPTLLFF